MLWFLLHKVGGAFNNPSTENELKTIASDPDDKHVFKVNDFSVLKEIQETLEENIIAIEGIRVNLCCVHFPYYYWPLMLNVRLLLKKNRKEE